MHQSAVDVRRKKIRNRLYDGISQRIQFIRFGFLPRRVLFELLTGIREFVQQIHEKREISEKTQKECIQSERIL